MVFWEYRKTWEYWTTPEVFKRLTNRKRELLRKWKKANLDKVSAYGKRSYFKDPTKSRQNHLKRVYSISVEQYDQLLQSQGNGCAICGTKSCSSPRHLAVDHDHTTGKIRGILCQFCNTALGKFKDDPNILKKAIDYLRRSSVEGKKGRTSVLPIK